MKYFESLIIEEPDLKLMDLLIADKKVQEEALYALIPLSENLIKRLANDMGPEHAMALILSCYVSGFDPQIIQSHVPE